MIVGWVAAIHIVEFFSGSRIPWEGRRICAKDRRASNFSPGIDAGDWRVLGELRSLYGGGWPAFGEFGCICAEELTLTWRSLASPFSLLTVRSECSGMRWKRSAAVESGKALWRLAWRDCGQMLSPCAGRVLP